MGRTTLKMPLVISPMCCYIFHSLCVFMHCVYRVCSVSVNTSVNVYEREGTSFSRFSAEREKNPPPLFPASHCPPICPPPSAQPPRGLAPPHYTCAPIGWFGLCRKLAWRTATLEPWIMRHQTPSLREGEREREREREGKRDERETRERGEREREQRGREGERRETERERGEREREKENSEAGRERGERQREYEGER